MVSSSPMLYCCPEDETTPVFFLTEVGTRRNLVLVEAKTHPLTESPSQLPHGSEIIATVSRHV